MATNFLIRQMKKQDIDGIFTTFARWHKKQKQYQKYFIEQERDRHLVLVALNNERIVGYTTLVWDSKYEPFHRDSIPEIVDLNVFNEYQRQGIGTALIQRAEQIAFQRGKARVGISVEQTSKYDAANRLYRNLGYVPDGRGITPDDGELHLIKMLVPSFNPGQLLRQDLSDFPPYSMGHVPLADLGRYVKLDLNENAFGPSPKAIAALAEMRHYNRYVGQDELREAIARYVGVDVAHIVVSNGADEIIDLIQRVFLNRGDAIMDCPPSFEMYAFFARVNGAQIVSVPRRDAFSVDVEAIESVIASREAAKQSPTSDVEIASSQSFDSASLRSGSLLAMTKPKLIFLANPNNPDGSMTSHADIERLLALPVMLVLDEAYAEFAGESYATRVPTQPSLIVLRTFSKWAGLASLRVGYCIAPKVVASRILQCKAPENVNAAGIVAARVSLDDLDYLMANVRRIVEERERLSGALAELGFLQPLPSRANFILCRVVGRAGKEIHDALGARGILIRAFGSPRLREYVRIAVGTPEQNEVLVRALKEL